MRAHEAVLHQLEDSILRGELLPGSRLPSERELLTQFGVSRATIREALRVAETVGLIEVRPGDPSGALVTANPSVGVSRMIESFVRAERGSLTDIIQLRMLVEGFAAFLAARRPPEQLQDLAEAFEKLAASETEEERREADAVFHLCEVEASGNSMLIVIARALRESIVQVISLGLPAVTEEPREAHAVVVERHREILDAIRSGDGLRACQLSRASLLKTYATLVPAEDRERLEAVLAFGPGVAGDVPQQRAGDGDGGESG